MGLDQLNQAEWATLLREMERRRAMGSDHHGSSKTRPSKPVVGAEPHQRYYGRAHARERGDESSRPDNRRGRKHTLPRPTQRADPGRHADAGSTNTKPEPGSGHSRPRATDETRYEVHGSFHTPANRDSTHANGRSEATDPLEYGRDWRGKEEAAFAARLARLEEREAAVQRREKAFGTGRDVRRCDDDPSYQHGPTQTWPFNRHPKAMRSRSGTTEASARTRNEQRATSHDGFPAGGGKAHEYAGTDAGGRMDVPLMPAAQATLEGRAASSDGRWASSRRSWSQSSAGSHTSRSEDGHGRGLRRNPQRTGADSRGSVRAERGPAGHQPLPANFQSTVPTCRQLLSSDRRDIAQWVEVFQRYVAKMDDIWRRHGVDLESPISELVIWEVRCTISEQMLHRAHRTEIGASPNEVEVERFLRGTGTYATNGAAIGKLFYADPLVNFQMLQWPEPVNISAVVAMEKYFNAFRRLKRTVREDNMPTPEELVQVILDAIRPDDLQEIVRNRIRNGRPPTITGPVEEWRKDAVNNVMVLLEVIRENAEEADNIRGHTAIHGAGVLHAGAQTGVTAASVSHGAKPVPAWAAVSHEHAVPAPRRVMAGPQAAPGPTCAVEGCERYCNKRKVGGGYFNTCYHHGYMPNAGSDGAISHTSAAPICATIGCYRRWRNY